LIDIGDDPAFTPQFVDVLNSIFDLNAQGGRAAFGIALRRIDPTLIPDTCAGLPACTMGDYEIFFATSRISARLAQILARGADLCRPGLGTSEDPDPCTAGIVPRTMALVESTQVRLDIYLADGSDTRDIKFSRDGTRAYVVDRQPPSVLVMDTSPIPPPAGDPRDVILRAIEVCPQPSLLALREDAGPLRVYVTCFAAGEIFVVDPLRAEVVDVIEVGRGPNAVQIFRDPTPDGNHELLGIVANFADNDIAVISLEPGKATENTVLFKIGMPNPVAQH